MKTFETGKIYSSNEGRIKIEIVEKNSNNLYSVKKSWYGSDFKETTLQVYSHNDIEFFEEDGGYNIIIADESLTNEEIFNLYKDYMKPYGENNEYVNNAKRGLAI